MKKITLTPDPEPKPIFKVSTSDKIINELRKRKKMRYMQIMNFVSHGGGNSMVLNGLVRDGIITKNKYDCGTCEYFELVKKKK